MTPNEPHHSPLCDEDIQDDLGLAERLADLGVGRSALSRRVPLRPRNPVGAETLAAARTIA